MRETLMALAAVVLALLGLFVFLARRRQQSLPGKPERHVRLTPSAQLYKLQKGETFWGVSVESHCGASSRLAGVKYPLDSAPRLPVRGCDAETCRCNFIGLAERRRLSERRRGHDRRGSIRMESTERRAERPRRNDDFVAWQAYRHL